MTSSLSANMLPDGIRHPLMVVRRGVGVLGSSGAPCRRHLPMIESDGARYVAVCGCGWRSGRCSYLANAKRAGRRHTDTAGDL